MDWYSFWLWKPNTFEARPGKKFVVILKIYAQSLYCIPCNILLKIIQSYQRIGGLSYSGQTDCNETGIMLWKFTQVWRF